MLPQSETLFDIVIGALMTKASFKEPFYHPRIIRGNHGFT